MPSLWGAARCRSRQGAPWRWPRPPPAPQVQRAAWLGLPGARMHIRCLFPLRCGASRLPSSTAQPHHACRPWPLLPQRPCAARCPSTPTVSTAPSRGLGARRCCVWRRARPASTCSRRARCAARCMPHTGRQVLIKQRAAHSCLRPPPAAAGRAHFLPALRRHGAALRHPHRRLLVSHHQRRAAGGAQAGRAAARRRLCRHLLANKHRADRIDS